MESWSDGVIVAVLVLVLDGACFFLRVHSSAGEAVERGRAREISSKLTRMRR